ncbi:MAG: dihydrodipicolinate synthase family protein [Verrucomicrobia bacterium]|nr:dihydrodipicolinate synthase family protein [Verrucomicrobiota bacterium]
MKTWREHEWAGVFPATLCAFHEDESLDESSLREYFRELAGIDGVNGLVCNGHTGEIMSLRPPERARVARILVETVRPSGRPVKAVTGLSAEGSLEAVDHALAAKEAGADAILLMPPHHWLRFGRNLRTAVGFFEDVARGADIPIVVHQYPAWTKASYSLAELLEIVKIPQVVMIKMGTRDMARWLWDYERLKEAAPHVSIVTCHDEFLLPSLVEGSDGALIGFAGFAPELMVQLVHAALDGDLARAKAAQKLVAPLARLIYNFGEPGCGAHQRMKVTRWLMGKFPSPHFRRPVRPLPDAEVQRLRTALEEIGFRCGGAASDGPQAKRQANAAEQRQKLAHGASLG